MPKGTILTCPECKREYEQVKDERPVCTGKLDANTIPHKKAQVMK